MAFYQPPNRNHKLENLRKYQHMTQSDSVEVMSNSDAGLNNPQSLIMC